MGVVGSEQVRVALYEAGLTDGLIAKRLGVDRTAVRQWRKRRGFPARVASAPIRAKGHQESERRDLYDQGYTDKRIALALGVSASAICGWRKARGLPAMNPRHRRPLLPVNDGALEALHAEGLTDNNIAERLQIPHGTIRNHRRALGLSGNRGQHPGGPVYDWTERHRLYASGMNDGEVAARQGVSVTSLGRWRRRRGITSAGRKVWNVRVVPPNSGWIAARYDPTYAAVLASIGPISPDLRDDAASLLYIDVIEGKIPSDAVVRLGQRYTRRALNMFASSYGPRSLDEVVDGTNNVRLSDFIRDDRSSSWLEEMGATAW